jgi:hypothetical protein
MGFERVSAGEVNDTYKMYVSNRRIQKQANHSTRSYQISADWQSPATLVC